MSRGKQQQSEIQIEREVLDNGLRILMLERPGLPLLSYHLLVETGTIDEAGAEESGLAQLTTQLLSQGTTELSALELALAVENLGASLGAHCDRDFTTIGLSSLARDQSAALSLLAGVARRPAFAAEEVERKRQEICTVLKRNEDDPGYHVSRLLADRLYGDHPYSHAVLGNAAVVESLQREDLLRFYETHFVPRRSVLAIVGEFDRDRVLTEVAAEFADWKESGAVSEVSRPDQRRSAAAEIPTPEIPASRDTHQMNGVTQATVRMGCRSISRRHPDYMALVVLDHVLGGGGFSSRLMQSLRDEMGWTYGASSALQLHREGGAWIAGFKTSHDTLDPAIERMLAEIDRLGRSGPTDDEVEQARAYLTGSLPLDFETNAQWASHALEAELFGLPEFFWEEEAQRLRELKMTDLAEIGSRYLRSDRFAVAVNGDFRGTDSGV